MPDSDPFVGTRIREYEILARISQGRMGAVYRARHVLLEQERAIKIVQTGMAGSSELAERFTREARILARMRHPNLVELYEFGKLDEGTFFMIQELLEGESVRARIERLERIPPLDAVRIAREAALGLHLAHSMGILHRDVCPNNLFLVRLSTGEEITKIIDFAIAKPTAQEARTSLQSIPALIGRPEFWSPEQFGITGEEVALDQRSDIYSLGVTLYNMLSGKLPFVSLVPKGTPEPISSDQVPPKLERLIRKALSLDRDSRQASMMDFIQELDEVTYREASTTIRLTERPPEPGRFEPGYVFAGRYEVQKKIGKGGMGTVFKATDRILEIPVALKTINPDASADAKVLARLKREVILARKVAHPNVCRLYDIGECEGTHYVSMEFVDGMTLSDMLLVRGKLPQEEGLRILRQVVLALQEAHRAGVIHRDLKPQNIMVDVHQRAYIMDFGISYSADVGRLTATGMMIGTPRYMAPEQFGESGSDLRADIYSMGIIFYEVFTGRLPFDAKTPATVMYAHIHTPPTPPRQLNPGISQKLEAIILKALEKDPKNRFQNAGELLDAVDDLLADSLVLETPKHPAPQGLLAERQSPIQPSPQPRPPAPRAAPPPARPQPPLPAGTYPRLPPEPRSLVAPLILVFLALIAAGVAGWYYLIRSSAPEPSSTAQAPPVTHPPAREPPTDTGKKEARTPESRPAEEEQQQQQQGPAQQGPETAPSEQAPSQEQETPANSPATLQIPPVPEGPGRIEYQGRYPVSIFNGRKLVLDTSTADSAELPAGAYKLTLISTAGAIIRQIVRVTVKPGETFVIPAPQMSRFSLNATPSNCKIFIDAVFVDVAPVFDFPIQAGDHHVRTLWEKLGREKSGFFTVGPNQSISLRAIADETTLDIFEEKR